jgi:hypothetical protein
MNGALTRRRMEKIMFNCGKLRRRRDLFLTSYL